MPDTPEYPYDLFPSDVLRRVLGSLPAPKTQDELDANVAERVESIRAERHPDHADDPIDVKPYPQGYTLRDLIARLAKDENSILDDVTGRRDYTDDEVRDALTWNIEQGFAVQDGEQFCMTRDGLAALCE